MDGLKGSGVPRRGDQEGQLGRYIINPALVPRVWSGPSWGYRAFRNASRLNSAWLGIGWHLLCLPQRVWWEVLRSSWKDPLLVAHHLLSFMTLTVAFVVLGLTGWLVMLPYPLEVIKRARILDEDEARRDVRAGETAPVRPA